MNEDGMSRQRLRNVAEAVDLMGWFVSRERPWLSRLERLRSDL